MAEAAAQFQKGLDQLAMMPDSPERRPQELEFSTGLGATLMIVKGFAAPETGQVYGRARQLWEELGCPAEFLHVPRGQALYHNMRGEIDLAQRLDAGLLLLSRQRDDSAGLVLGHLCSGQTQMYAGNFAASQSHLEKVLALYDPHSHRSLVYQAGQYPHVNARAHLGIVLFCLGLPQQALAQVNEAIAEARRLAHPPSLAANLAPGARLLSLCGDNAALSEWTDELVALTNEQGFPLWRALGTIFRGWVKVKEGDVAEGISILRNGSAAYRATGAELYMPYHIALIAAACEIAGQVEEAARLLDIALQAVERTGERWFAAEMYRQKGQLLQRQGRPDSAENLYRKALRIAREQQAKLWELRAATSLARLWRDQGKRTEARDLLVPVYDWFTEGHDTPMLKQAKALLEQLSAWASRLLAAKCLEVGVPRSNGRLPL
jgi:predicted ATPase